MKESYFIGVDSGSQSTKVTIFNAKGEVVCSDSEPIRPMIYRQPGHVEHPDDDLWDSIQVVLKKVMAKFEGDVASIKGLGLCTIRCCRVFMKADGSLAEPVMSWMDVRAYEKFEDRDDIAFTCPSTGYITNRLTGEFRDTAANAFQWQFPLDVDTWQWSTDKEVFESFGIPKEKLPELRMPGEILGYVTEEAAALTGLPVGLPVVATANDKAVEALGAGLLQDDTGLISLGTYIASMVCGKGNAPDPQSYFTNLSCIPNRYLYESSGIRRGMWLVSWYKNIIGEAYRLEARSKGMLREEYLETEALEVPIGSDGLLIIPDWLAPATQLYRKGVMIGFDERHTRGHIYRAVLEGIALTLKAHYDAMVEELGTKPEKIIISGGGANSDLFMQIFADMYGVTTVRNKLTGAAGLGAAICAAVAAKEYDTFDDAVANMVRTAKEFAPNEENHKQYQKFYQIHKQLPGLMEDTLKKVYDAIQE